MGSQFWNFRQLLDKRPDEDRMFGTALVVGNEAIKFHLLYPQGVAPLY